MMDALEALVCRMLRVPPEPEPPPGEPGTFRQFRAARNLYRLNVFGWTMGQAAGLAGLLAGYIAIRYAVQPERLRTYLLLAEVLGAAIFLVQIPFTFAVLRLDYRMRWYMVTDRSLRIREGVFTVDEKTVTFANIQNLQVRQGPLQRLLGIADIEVKTAGGGGSEGHKKSGENAFARDLHTAYFRGVDNAEAIRDIIMSRLQAHKGSGLGDPDDVHEERGSLDETLKGLRDAARSLQETAARLAGNSWL